MRARVAGLLPILLLLACGGADRSDPPIGAGATAAGGAGGSRASGGRGGSETAGEATGGADSAAGAGGSALGGESSVMIEDVADSGPCQSADDPGVVFMAPEPLELVYDQAGRVGERRYAFDSVSLALITFADDEASASPIAQSDFVGVTSLDDALVTLEIDEAGGLVARAYTSTLERKPGEVALDAAPTSNHALASSAQGLLAVWNRAGVLAGQAFTLDGPDAAFDFGASSCGTDNCSALVVAGDPRSVVLWSRQQGERSVLSWAAVEHERGILSTRNVLEAEDPLRLTAATPLPDGRMAVLLSEGAPAVAPVLLFLDEFGRIEPQLWRLLGVDQAWGIGADDAGLAVVGRSGLAQGVLRRLSFTGAPVSDWICLDDSGPGTAFEPRVALFDDGPSLGAVVRKTDGAAAYLALP